MQGPTTDHTRPVTSAKKRLMTGVLSSAAFCDVLAPHFSIAAAHTRQLKATREPHVDKLVNHSKRATAVHNARLTKADTLHWGDAVILHRKQSHALGHVPGNQKQLLHSSDGKAMVEPQGTALSTST